MNSHQSSQTLIAWGVLADARLAIGLLEGCEYQDRYWRVYWTAAISLIRLIGDVLHKVDAKKSDTHKMAIGNHWATITARKPEPSIFWEFIKRERDLTLHEYQFSFGWNMDLIGIVNNGVVYFEDDGTPFLIDFLRYPLAANDKHPFAGQDVRDILNEAILWWENELAGIEMKIAPAKCPCPKPSPDTHR